MRISGAGELGMELFGDRGYRECFPSYGGKQGIPLPGGPGGNPEYLHPALF